MSLAVSAEGGVVDRGTMADTDLAFFFKHLCSFLHKFALSKPYYAMLACQAITGVAQSHNLAVSFLPKYISNAAGNGCHMHLSLHQVSFATYLGLPA